MSICTDSSNRPRLRHCTIIGTGPEQALVIAVGAEQYHLGTESGTNSQFLRLKRYLDGRHTIDEMARRTGLDTDEVAGVVEVLRETGLLRQEGRQDRISTAVFLDEVEKACLMWRRQIGYHRLFGQLLRGEVPADVFRGLLFETYHFVAAAATHIGVAVAHASDERWRRILSRYLSEEYDHANLVLQAAERTGTIRGHILSAHPIIGTMSLIQMLCEVGRQSTLGYLACTNLFEGGGDDFVASRTEFEAMASHYGFGTDVVAPIIEHAKMDVEAGHGGLLREALADLSAIGCDQANQAVNHLHDLKHAFDQYHDQILLYYSDMSNYIPRLKVDFFSL